METQQESKRIGGGGEEGAQKTSPYLEGQGCVFKSTSAGFEYSCPGRGKDEKLGGDSGTKLEHNNRIP